MTRQELDKEWEACLEAAGRTDFWWPDHKAEVEHLRNETERTAMVDALRWAAKRLERESDLVRTPTWLEGLADDIANGGSISE